MYKATILCTLLATTLIAMDSSKFVKICDSKKNGKLSKAHILKTPDGFAVIKNNRIQPIKPHDIDPLIKKLNTNEKLNKFLENGYLALSQYNNGDYKLTAKVCGLGGGPVVGVAMLSWSKGSLL